MMNNFQGAHDTQELHLTSVKEEHRSSCPQYSQWKLSRNTQTHTTTQRRTPHVCNRTVWKNLNLFSAREATDLRAIPHHVPCTNVWKSEYTQISFIHQDHIKVHLVPMWIFSVSFFFFFVYVNVCVCACVCVCVYVCVCVCMYVCAHLLWVRLGWSVAENSMHYISLLIVHFRCRPHPFLTPKKQ